jgi:hypothetical protein
MGGRKVAEEYSSVNEDLVELARSSREFSAASEMVGCSDRMKAFSARLDEFLFGGREPEPVDYWVRGALTAKKGRRLEAAGHIMNHTLGGGVIGAGLGTGIGVGAAALSRGKFRKTPAAVIGGATGGFLGEGAGLHRAVTNPRAVKRYWTHE